MRKPIDFRQLPAIRTVARGVLFYTLVASAGCIVPVPLDREPTVTNSKPVIDNRDASPTFGLVSRRPSDSFPFEVHVDDADLDDVLSARLFRPGTGGGMYTLLQSLDPLVPAPDAVHPGRRTATFAELHYCTTLGVNSGSQLQLTVFVTDQGFVGDGADTNGVTDSSDSGVWVLTCN